MAAFYLLHAADVWTTKEGLKYDCIVESNPLLPKNPHINQLIIHKGIFLYPFDIFYKTDNLTNQDMIFPITIASWVVYNNLKVTDRAKQRCNKR